jgi:hypothetical protein
MKAGLASAFALAAVSAVLAVVLSSRMDPLAGSAAALLSVAVPVLLAPLFWPREDLSLRRLVLAIVAQLAAFAAVALVLWFLRGVVPSPSKLAPALLLSVLVVAALHQLAALVAPLVQRAGASAASAREWAVWTVAALLWVTASAPLWLGPVADLGAVARPGLPSLVIAVSPLAQLAAAAGHDLLRDQWFYAHSSLGSLQAEYPPLAGVLLAYVIAGVAFTLLARAESKLLPALALLVVLGGAASVAQSAPAEVEAVPAWGGWSRPGRTTEIDVRLVAERRDTVEVRIVAGSSTVRSSVQLEPGQPSRHAIPVPSAERVTVGVRRGQRTVTPSEIRLSLAESPLVAWVAAAPAATIPGFHVLPLDALQLPESSSAYSAIDAIVIDRRNLASLTQPQLAALLSYLAGCGAAVVVATTPGDDALLRSAVGCGEKKFEVAGTYEEAAGRLASVAATVVDLAPGTPALAAAFGPDLRAWHRIVAVLAVCAAAVVIVGVLTSSLAAAAVAPALLAAGVVVLLQTRPVESRLVVWAESDSGERVARYRALQLAAVTRRGTVDVPVLGELAQPQSCRAGQRVSWQWDAATARYVGASFDGRLLAPAAICYSGEFPVGRAAFTEDRGAGRIALANSGASGWPAGWLAWGGQVFPLAPLAPGQDVVVDPASGATAAGGAQALALARTSVDRKALLWALDLSRVTDAPPATQAWLLLRVAAADPR